MLENKTAVIYGGRGAIGGAVARAFAGAGARVYLAGRTRARLEKVANDIGDAAGVGAESEALGTPHPPRPGPQHQLGRHDPRVTFLRTSSDVHACLDTGRGTNWAVGRRPVSRCRGVYIIDGSNDPDVDGWRTSHRTRGSAVGLNS